MDKAKIHQIADRAEKLGELKRHPGWELLTSIFEKKKDAYFKYVTANLMQTGNVPEDFEYRRGFFAGATYILSHPENAETTFETALKKADRLREF